MIIKKNSFADLYESVLNNVMRGYVSAPRGLTIKELSNCTLILNDPISCFFLNDRRSTQYKYIAAEYIWYLMGCNDTNFIRKYSKFWDSITNDDNTVNSSYGHLIFKERNNGNDLNQWQWAINSLIKDKYSRQAVMHFNKPHHQFDNNKDFVCTMYGIFHIRDNKLNFTIHMRSNDVVLGLPTDIPFFCLLQINALNILRKYYADLELGSYIHVVDSLHAYEHNFDLIWDMLKQKFIPNRIPRGSEFLINESGEPIQIIKNIYEHILYDMHLEDIIKHYLSDDVMDIERFLIDLLIKNP